MRTSLIYARSFLEDLSKHFDLFPWLRFSDELIFTIIALLTFIHSFHLVKTYVPHMFAIRKHYFHAMSIYANPEKILIFDRENINIKSKTL